MSTTTSAAFSDPWQAGRRLAAQLGPLRSEAPVVLSLSRTGVPVAAEVAGALGAPLDVLVVIRAGDAGSRVGAVAEGGLALIDHDRARALGVGPERLTGLRERAAATADDTARRLRAGAAPRDLVGRTVVLVDAGVGTGQSAIAGARTARRRGAARIVLAVPVADPEALARLTGELDEIICVQAAPRERWYTREPAVSDADVAAALGLRPVPTGLYLPEGARGAIVLVSPTAAVSRVLHDMGFATLTVTPDALAAAIERLRTLPATAHLALGALGLGAAAEVVLEAGASHALRAVVAVGGRPDRAAERFAAVQAATLLVIGGEDRHVLRLARAELDRLPGERRLAVVPGAAHDLDEPGVPEQVAHLAGAWFAHYFSNRR